MMRVIPNSADDISNRNDPRRYPKTRQCRAKESPRPHHFRHDLHAVASLQAESDIDRAYYGQEYGSELFLLHQRWLGLFEQVFRFDKWSPCRSYENDGPAKRDRLNSFFYLDP